MPPEAHDTRHYGVYFRASDDWPMRHAKSLHRDDDGRHDYAACALFRPPPRRQVNALFAVRITLLSRLTCR